MIFGGLCAVFAASLRPGRVDLVTAMARRLDPDWDSAMEAYTRGVTLAWAGFLGAQVLVSLLLFLLAPRAVWSCFVNLLDLPLVAAMYLAEHVWRGRRFPHRARIGPLQVVAAMREGVRPFGGSGPTRRDTAAGGSA